MPGRGDQQEDYRSYVGPADQYDLIGAAQFALLYALGLREHHRLLDVGCGSLRAGRMLISYQNPGGYTGVATNTGPALLPRLLQAIAQTVKPTGIAAVTFAHPGTGDATALEVQIDDQNAPAWRYPGCYSYARSAIADAIASAGLHGQTIGWYHPRHQWWLMTPHADGFPPQAFLAALAGPTLAQGCESSWRSAI